MLKFYRRLAGLACPNCGLHQPLALLNTMVGSEHYSAFHKCTSCGRSLRISRGNGIAHAALVVLLLSLPVPFLTTGDLSLMPGDPDGLFNWPLSPVAKSTVFYLAYVTAIVLPVSSRNLEVEVVE